MSPKHKIDKILVIQVFTLIQELENSLVTDVMMAQMHKDANLKQRVTAIQKLLDISRRYLVLGFEKKSYFSYLRALALYVNNQ